MFSLIVFHTKDLFKLTDRITIFLLIILLTSGIAGPVSAQSLLAWQAASDSSNSYFTKGKFEKAFDWGLVMVKEAEVLHAQNPEDTTLVASLVRVGIAQRLSTKPDMAIGAEAATRALNLLTPRLKESFLGAKVYSLNSIFNYQAGHTDNALLYGETAVSLMEKLEKTATSPYWEAQNSRIRIYLARKDSLSLAKAISIIHQTLPVTAKTFGLKSPQYFRLLRNWLLAFEYQPRLAKKQQATIDSLWEATAEVRRQSSSSGLDMTNLFYDAANYYSSVGRYEKSCEFAERMLAKAEQLYATDAWQDTTLIFSLQLLANNRAQLSQTHIQESVHYLDRAIALLKPAYESKLWVAELYAISGLIRWNAGDRQKALAHTQKAAELCIKLKQTENLIYVQTQTTLASIYSVSRDKEQLAVAQHILEALVPVVRRVAGLKSKQHVLTLGMLGTIYTMSMPLDDSTQRKADTIWQTLIPQTRQLGDPVQLCRMLNGLGEHYMAQHKIDSARTTFEESVRIGKTLSNQLYTVIALTNLSTIETNVGHYKEAVRISEEILATPEAQSLPQILLLTMANAVDGNRQLGRLDRAELLSRQAMKLSEEQFGTRTNYFYAVALGDLGLVYYQRSDFSNAAFYFEEALNLLEKTARPDDPVLARFRMLMGDIYANLDKGKALYNYKKARLATERQPNYEQSGSYLSVLQSEVVLLRELGRYTESVSLADSVIQFYRHVPLSNQNALPLFLGDAYYTYHHLGRQAATDSIKSQLKQALVSSDTLSDAAKVSMLKILGIAYEFDGNYAESIRYLSESIRINQNINQNTYNINAYLPVRVAMCHLNLGNRAEAIRILDESVQRLRKNVAGNLWYMSENQREVYMEDYALPEIYATVFSHPNPAPKEVELAYNYRLLIQGLLFNTHRKVVRLAEQQPDTVLKKRIAALLTIRKTIAQYSLKPDPNVDIDSLSEQATQLEKQIGHFASTIRQQARIYTWQDVRKSLKPGEAALEIVRFNRWAFEKNAHETDTVEYAALLVRPEWATPHLVRLPNGKAMESDWLTAYQQSINKAQASGSSYQRFWQPITNELQGVQKLFVAADGVYHLISLPTLYNPIRHRYLADELQLVMVGSTRDLTNEYQHSATSTSELIGFPAYRAQRAQLVRSEPASSLLPGRTRGGLVFDDLPATKTEVEAIARLLNKSHIRANTKLGVEASEQALKTVRSPRILHIATHGYFQPDTLNPFYKLNRLLACGLALAGAADTTNAQLHENEDGILTGYEASLLNLNGTELVTLSACETGVGNATAGEGVFGLQRAFLLAGTQSVLMSLWRVNDQLALQLMTDFYRYWLGGMPKPQALRQAQLQLRKQYPEPYYWGAFVLLGQ